MNNKLLHLSAGYAAAVYHDPNYAFSISSHTSFFEEHHGIKTFLKKYTPSNYPKILYSISSSMTYSYSFSLQDCYGR
jgi:hypothetical protein